MCGRTVQSRSTGDLVADYDIAVLGEGVPEFNWNIKPTQMLATIIESAKGEDDVQRRLEPARWSLVPSWSKEMKLKYPTFNARSEGITGKRTFAGPLRTHRAVIPATGYYEWKTEGKLKTPYFIYAPDGQQVNFAGLYSWWKAPATEDWLLTATIITREAVGGLRDIHLRTPVTLPENWISEWLSPETEGNQVFMDAAVAAAAPVAESLEFHQVGPVTGNSPDMLNPL